MHKAIPADQRFWAKVDRAGDCWEWTAARYGNGYGAFCLGAPTLRQVVAHRFAYELLVGEIPEDLQIDHLCRNRGCVNPSHLEAVTARENMHRIPDWHGLRTHCAAGGHPLVTAPNGKRYCRECQNERKRRKRAAGALGQKPATLC